MEITDAHVEYAVLQRLREMLDGAREIALRFCREMETASKKSHLKADSETIGEAA